MDSDKPSAVPVGQPPATDQQRAQAVIRREKEQTIVNLSRSGATNAEIATQLRAQPSYIKRVLRKYYRKAAHDFVVDDAGDRAKAILQLQAVQLELTVLMRKPFKPPTGADGKPIVDPDWELKVAETKGRAGERLVRVIERIAKLRGWDKPAPKETSNLTAADVLALQLENATDDELTALETIMAGVHTRKVAHESSTDEAAPERGLGYSSDSGPPGEGPAPPV